MKSYLLGAVAGATIIGALALGGAQVLANGFGQGGNMAEELSQKLNISQEQVETAMDTIYTERQAERQADVSAKLDEAVADGALTAEQKQLILDKQAERQASRDKNRAEMETWATENGIDCSELREYGIGGLGNGTGMGGHGYGRSF